MLRTAFPALRRALRSSGPLSRAFASAPASDPQPSPNQSASAASESQPKRSAADRVLRPSQSDMAVAGDTVTSVFVLKNLLSTSGATAAVTNKIANAIGKWEFVPVTEGPSTPGDPVVQVRARLLSLPLLPLLLRWLRTALAAV